MKSCGVRRRTRSASDAEGARRLERQRCVGARHGFGQSPLEVQADRLVVDDRDLVWIEGRLAKTPSCWARRVDIVRTSGRIDGHRVPLETPPATIPAGGAR